MVGAFALDEASGALLSGATELVPPGSWHALKLPLSSAEESTKNSNRPRDTALVYTATLPAAKKCVAGRRTRKPRIV